MTTGVRYRGSGHRGATRRDFLDDGRPACDGRDPELFFPHSQDDAEKAKEICRGCEVVVGCLRWAMEQVWDLSGVWGATTELDRLRLHRRRTLDQLVANVHKGAT